MRCHAAIPSAALIVLGLQSGCAANRPPTVTLGPRGDTIPEAEIQKEMQSVRGVRDAYPFLFLLAGGAVGMVVGCGIGAQFDTGPGQEDPGLGGCVAGAATGLVGGIAGGLVLGTHLAEKTKRAEAIRRIRARRA